MSVIIQTPSTEYKNKSMYFEKMDFDNEGEFASFSHDIGSAKEFPTKEEAKAFIKEKDLDHCHLLPS